MKTIYIILFLSLLIKVQAETYYVDAENGKDSYSGKTVTKAWKTIEKVNSKDFKPGDQILFKRGNKWIDMLTPHNSGDQTNNITYGAYGEGSLPIITLRQRVPNSNKNSKWAAFSQNIYTLTLDLGSTELDRMWLDDVEYDHASDLSDIDSVHRWFYDKKGKTLYIYSQSNPSDFYKSIEFPGGIDNKFYALQIKNQDYLTFSKLDLQGGFTACIGIKGSNHLIFEDCNIGSYAHGRGIIGNQYTDKAKDSVSNYIIIRNNTFDSKWKIFAGYNRAIMDAISIQNGGNYWEVYKNKFINWDHAAIQIYGIKAPACHNKIYQNFITAPDLANSRAFETVGTDMLMCSYNEFYRNRITNTRTRSQFGGTHNKIYYNIFDHMKNATVEHGGHTTAQAINFAKVAGPSEYNIACNNTIYATDRDGIWDYGNNNTIVNNLIINPGIKNKGTALTISRKVKGSIWENNLIYIPDLSESNDLVDYQERKYSMREFNSLNGNNEHKISGNIQYTGKLSNLIVDPENSNFSPVKNSPLIDAGKDMGFHEDFYGHPIVNKPDIGAVEYSSDNYGKN